MLRLEFTAVGKGQGTGRNSVKSAPKDCCKISTRANSLTVDQFYRIFRFLSVWPPPLHTQKICDSLSSVAAHASATKQHRSRLSAILKSIWGNSQTSIALHSRQIMFDNCIRHIRSSRLVKLLTLPSRQSMMIHLFCSLASAIDAGDRLR